MKIKTNRQSASCSRALITLMSAIVLSACNSGSSDSSQPSTLEPADQEPSGELTITDATGSSGTSVLAEAISELPTEDTQSGGAGLVIDTSGDCASAGSPVSLALFSRDAQVGLEPEADSNESGNNVTAFTEFSVDADSAASGVEVVSHTDSQFDLTIPTPDIVSISANFAGGSVTDFIAAWPTDAPESAVLVVERDNGVCLYSMRLPGFCGTTRTAGATVQVALGEQVLNVSGCMINQAPNIPVLRIN